MPPASDSRASPRLTETQPLLHFSQFGPALSINTTSVFGTVSSSGQVDKFVQTGETPKANSKPPKPKRPSFKTDKRSRERKIE